MIMSSRLVLFSLLPPRSSSWLKYFFTNIIGLEWLSKWVMIFFLWIGNMNNVAWFIRIIFAYDFSWGISKLDPFYVSAFWKSPHFTTWTKFPLKMPSFFSSLSNLTRQNGTIGVNCLAIGSKTFLRTKHNPPAWLYIVFFFNHCSCSSR